PSSLHVALPIWQEIASQTCCRNGEHGGVPCDGYRVALAMGRDRDSAVAREKRSVTYAIRMMSLPQRYEGFQIHDLDRIIADEEQPASINVETQPPRVGRKRGLLQLFAAVAASIHAMQNKSVAKSCQ